MPRDITAKELRVYLDVPELHARNGVLCIGLLSGEVVRITSYVDWFRFEHFALDERDQCNMEER